MKIMAQTPSPSDRYTANVANVIINTFGTKNRSTGLPVSGYMVNVSHFRDPLGAKGGKFKSRNGLDPEVRAFIRSDVKVEGLKLSIMALAYALIVKRTPGSNDWFTVTIEDHHGQWIAPAVAEEVADFLTINGIKVCTNHHGIKAPKAPGEVFA